MSTKGKAALVLVAVLANVVIFFWRLNRGEEELPKTAARPMPLGQAQSAAVIAWEEMEVAALTPEEISAFVAQMNWNGCGHFPSGVRIVSKQSLASDKQKDLAEAVAGLLSAYVAGTPDALLAYMSGRGQTIAPSMIAEFRHMLVTDGGLDSEVVEAMDERQALLEFAERIGYGTHWTNLIQGAGCVTIWSKVDNSKSELPAIGDDAVDLFKNQTRYHHLFVDSERKSSIPMGESYALYADVRVVIEHDEELLGERSPYVFRFGYDEKRARWQPVEMVHIGTVAGRSPALLF